MRNVEVIIEHLAKEKILAFAKAVNTEIGGLMAVRQQGRTLIVKDAWTVPQEVTAGGVDFEVGHFEDHMRAMGWVNGKPMPHICMGIWHSHGNSGVFWSPTDEQDLSRKYAMRGFLVNVVVNQKGDWLCQVDSMVGPEQGTPNDYVLVMVPNVLKLVTPQDPSILEQVNAEIAANVRERKVTIIEGFQDWNRGEMGYMSKDNKEQRRSRSLYTKARERDPFLGGVWSINKKTKCMEKWQGGHLVAIIDNMGDGTMTLYDDNGKVLMTEKNFGRKGGFPPAEL